MSNLVASLRTGTPRKVLQKAFELGVHADCVAAGAENACDECVELFHSSFAFHYGHINSLEDVLVAIVDDLLNDRKTA